ncbi:MAG TPA: hypothetical protein VGD81_17325 [Opitutaceae bacterium]
MILAEASSFIRQCRDRMHALYNKPVFDEWIVVTLQPGAPVLSFYEGPRVEQFRQRFLDDVAPLRQELEGRHLSVGDFAFVLDATGTAYDACVRLGGASYLLCNHTTRSMAEIRQDPLWLAAQKVFVELTEKFRADPLA